MERKSGTHDARRPDVDNTGNLSPAHSESREPISPENSDAQAVDALATTTPTGSDTTAPAGSPHAGAVVTDVAEEVARACRVQIDRVSIIFADTIEQFEQLLAAEPPELGGPMGLFAELPKWFGPGADAEALLDMMGARLSLGDLTDAAAYTERLITWLRYLQVTIAARMTGELLIRTETGEHPPPPGTDIHDLAASAITDELTLATGAKRWQVEGQVAYATRAAGPQRAAFTPLTDALRDGAVAWERASHTECETRGQDADAVANIVSRILEPVAKGEVVSWNSYRGRLARAIRRFGRSEPRRRKALRDRHAWARLHDNGTGTIGVTGSGERVVAAHDRIDSLARSLRAGGDKRTLEQLRSDIALDLLNAGRLDTFPGGVPAGRISVTVSLASMLGATDADGETRLGPLPAAVVRDIALAEGNVLARIVTDPVTGIALDASTERYRPTPAMRRFLNARHRWCSAPGCSQPAETCDMDHTTPWPHGETGPRNLSPKHRRHHEYKTRRWWHATQDPDGTINWRTLTGRQYTVRPHQYDHDLRDDAETITRIPIHPCGCMHDPGGSGGSDIRACVSAGDAHRSVSAHRRSGGSDDAGMHLDAACHPADAACHIAQAPGGEGSLIRPTVAYASDDPPGDDLDTDGGSWLETPPAQPRARARSKYPDHYPPPPF